MNKLLDVILLTLAVFFCIIGLHQTMVNGFAASYWIFMLTIIFLSVLNMRKNKQKKIDQILDKKATKKHKKGVKAPR